MVQNEAAVPESAPALRPVIGQSCSKEKLAMNSIHASLGAAAVALMLAACGGTHAPIKATSAEQAQAPAPAGAHCPAIKHAQAIVGDTKTGVAIAFSAPAAEIDQLRTRVHALAEHENAGPGAAACPCPSERGVTMEQAGLERRGATMAQPEPPMPASTASVQDFMGGAQLILTPKDPAQLPALRAYVRAHRDRMRSCLGL
jgi:hypothetical protein